jgi:16S rRNA (guanine966-N2)-methyltransferase
LLQAHFRARYAVAGMSRHSKSAAQRPNQLPNKLRIIGGRWRGIAITFPPKSALRPTPDRVRETLFNWLQPVIAGARCLDLFAGSGVLGFEALSRGARKVISVDSDRDIVRHLQITAAKLRTEGCEVIESEALKFLAAPHGPFDLVFLDPPYAAMLLPEVLQRLSSGQLSPGAFVYVEAAADSGLPPLPPGWSVHRSKSAGQVGYHLLRASS